LIKECSSAAALSKSVGIEFSFIKDRERTGHSRMQQSGIAYAFQAAATSVPQTLTGHKPLLPPLPATNIAHVWFLEGVAFIQRFLPLFWLHEIV
jgi:hypothetical protein